MSFLLYGLFRDERNACPQEARGAFCILTLEGRMA